MILGGCHHIFLQSAKKKNDAIQAEKLNNHVTFIESVANVLK